jgi:hypothetical protein
MVEANIINMFGFIFIHSYYEWGENFVQDYPNCTFEKLKQAFCKWFITMKNDEEVLLSSYNCPFAWLFTYCLSSCSKVSWWG